MLQKKWFWDLETLDLFTATFVGYDTDEIKTFVINDKSGKDERKELFNFLENEVDILIGYNSIFFDAQIIEYMYRYPYCKAQDIRKYASIITGDNNRRPDVPEWNLKRHIHIDLFKALSLSTKAKMTGWNLLSINQFNCWNTLKLIIPQHNFKK